jgi:acyl-CoA dehydrogenase
VDFEIPADLAAYLAELDEFIELQIRPLERHGDNARFFDHRREDARTDWDRGGLPSREWEALLAEAVRRADAAGHYRYAFPAEYGGRDGTNLGMAVIREHLAGKGLGLHCDLQNEHMVVGNNVGLLLMLHYGTPEQRAEWAEELAAGRRGFAFGITEPAHGSDATFMETSARREQEDWVINGEKTWNTGVHAASHDLIFARTSGRPGDADGITAFLTPVDSPGFTVEEYLWTFNMPTDHARITLRGVRVPDTAVFGGEGRGLHPALGRHLHGAGAGAPVRRAPVRRTGRGRAPRLRAGMGSAAPARAGCGGASRCPPAARHRRRAASPGPARTADGERTAGGRPGVPHRAGHARQHRPAGFPRPRRR